MIAIGFPELKDFTSQLFVQGTFHEFSVYEASFITGCSYMIDGHRNTEYYSPEENQNKSDAYITWEELKPICFSIIRGKRLPLQFKIVLRAPEALTHRLLLSADTNLTSQQVETMHLIIQYRDGAISCTTGTALNFFTLDKTIDQLWDRYVLQFLEMHQLEYRFLT